MALRKALSYSKKSNRPNTRRSSKRSKSYVKTVPAQKIVRFKMGATNDYETGKFKHIIKVVSGENILIRDNAIEASRQYANKIFEEEMPGQYFFAVKIYPHHIMRENKVLTGAGADRVQTGMAHSFGVTMGRGAYVKKNQQIFLVAFSNEKFRKRIIDSLTKIKAKLPCHTRIVVEERK